MSVVVIVFLVHFVSWIPMIDHPVCLIRCDSSRNLPKPFQSPNVVSTNFKPVTLRLSIEF